MEAKVAFDNGCEIEKSKDIRKITIPNGPASFSKLTDTISKKFADVLQSRSFIVGYFDAEEDFLVLRDDEDVRFFLELMTPDLGSQTRNASKSGPNRRPTPRLILQLTLKDVVQVTVGTQTNFNPTIQSNSPVATLLTSSAAKVASNSSFQRLLLDVKTVVIGFLEWGDQLQFRLVSRENKLLIDERGLFATDERVFLTFTPTDTRSAEDLPALFNRIHSLDVLFETPGLEPEDRRFLHEQFMAVLAQTPNLTALSISSLEVYDDAMTFICLLAKLCGLPALHSLSWSGITLNEEQLVQLCECEFATRLTRLRMDSCIDDVGLTVLTRSSSLTNLTELALPSSSFTQDGLQAVAQSTTLGEIRWLCLWGTDIFADGVFGKGSHGAILLS